MKIALAQVPVPGSDATAFARRAAALGYDAIESRHPLRPEASSQPPTVPIACLATGVSMPQRRRDREQAGSQLRDAIDAAERLGCGTVKLLDTPVHPGQSAGQTAAEMGEWLLPLADHAAGRNVTLVVENALYFRRAKDLWMLLESISHPAVGAAWDLMQGLQAGESPSVSVPTLNLRLQYARVADAKAGAYCPLGEGEAPVEEFVRRLRGVGYGGYVTVAYGAGVSDEFLADAAVKLRTWAKPQVGKKGDAKPSGGGHK